MDKDRARNKTHAQLQARLKWEVACERIAIALNPPPGALPDGVYDLEAAVVLAQAALDELRAAFNADDESN